MRLLVALTLVLLGTGPALACGPDTDCAIGERTYRIDLPDGATGALIFAHGYKGTAEGTMRNRGLRAAAHAAGLAFVAADAGEDADWQIPNVPRNRDNDGSREMTYFDALIDDLVTRHGLRRDQIIMSGFSAGGMVTWELACKRGDRFRAFIPVSGTFWAPIPETCPTRPRALVHVHGMSDPVVPLAGRPIADTHQGDVHDALDLAVRTMGVGPARDIVVDDLDCNEQDAEDGAMLVFCTHPGGHSIRSAWLAAALRLIRTQGLE